MPAGGPHHRGYRSHRSPRPLPDPREAATDDGHCHPDTEPLDDADAERIFTAALRGDVAPGDAQAFAGHMLSEMARMSSQDGQVMRLYPGHGLLTSGMRRFNYAGVVL